MSETILDRIDERVRALETSDSAASKKAGLSPTYIRDLKRKNANPSMRALALLAKALETTPEFLIGQSDLRTPENIPLIGLPLIGVIAAGAFRDISIMNQDDDYPVISVPRNKNYPHARQYALEVSGDSMNEIVPDGAIVTCVNFADIGSTLRAGQIAHIERTIRGTTYGEVTLKEIGGEYPDWVLVPRSTNPEHKPISIHGDSVHEVTVKGIVTGEWRPFLV